MFQVVLQDQADQQVQRVQLERRVLANQVHLLEPQVQLVHQDQQELRVLVVHQEHQVQVVRQVLLEQMVVAL